MLRVVDIEFIRKKHYVEEWGIRKIAKHLEISRQSVRKALKSAEPWAYTLREPKPCPVMDPYREIIVGWLRGDQTAPRKQRHTAKRIYDRLCAEYGFSGGESTVRRYVRRLRGEIEGPRIDPKFVLHADPGEMAQVDWGQAKVVLAGVEQTVHLFCLRLRSSGVAFVWASLHERMEAFLEGHVRAFEWLRGVPEKIVYDNLSTAVRKILRCHERELHERFVVLRSHYLFDSVFCNPRAGHEKGSVEHLVGYARRNALTPMPHVENMDELNTILQGWCENDREKRQKDWEQERQSLRPLPAHPLKPCIRHFLEVNKLSLVTLERNRYSVPTEHIGQVVQVDIYTDRLEIWAGEQRIAEHARAYGRNHTQLKLEHYLEALALKPYAVTHAAVVRDLPEPYQTLRKLLCQRDPSGYRELVQILLLHREFPAEALRAAVQQALDSRRIAADEIRQDLLNMQRRPLLDGGADLKESLTAIEVSVGDPRKYDRLLGVSA